MYKKIMFLIITLSIIINVGRVVFYRAKMQIKEYMEEVNHE